MVRKNYRVSHRARTLRDLLCHEVLTLELLRTKSLANSFVLSKECLANAATLQCERINIRFLTCHETQTLRSSLASNPNEIVLHAHIKPKVARKVRVIPLPAAQLVVEPADTDVDDEFREDVRASQWIYAAQAAQVPETLPQSEARAATATRAPPLP
jgi:hypothetical protein